MFEVKRLNTIAYYPAWDEQKRLVKALDAGQINDQLLLLEHPHTVTLGRGSHLQNLLLTTQDYEAKGIDVVEIDRGGDVTYHGPGQLVGYPIFYLGEQKHDAHSYLRAIEEALIIAISSFGIMGERKDKHTGVWVNDEKVAAIGVKFHKARRGKGYITSHGFALNVNTDLRYFSTIVPCGITEYGVTSLSRLVGTEVDMDMVVDQVIAAMRKVFR